MNTKADINKYITQAKQGNLNAMNNLGWAYLNGDGVQKDYNKAIEYFEDSLWGGNANAAYGISYALGSKKGATKHEYDEAFFYGLHAAKAGNMKAQHLVGTYYSGETEYAKQSMIPTNFYTAIIWYRKSAEQGCEEAMHNLALQYRFGQGCERNMDTAIYWYTKAAEKGFLPSIQSLGTIYHGDAECGLLYLDGALAGHWLYEAAKRGDEERKKVLNYYYHYDERKNVWRRQRMQ